MKGNRPGVLKDDASEGYPSVLLVVGFGEHRSKTAMGRRVGRVVSRPGCGGCLAIHRHHVGDEHPAGANEGLFKPLAETTAAFLEFAINSCRARRQGITVATALYAGFFSFMVAWKHRQLAAEMPLDVGTYLTSGRVMTQCAITAVLAALLSVDDGC